MDRKSDLGGIAAMLATTAFFVVGDSFMKLVTEDLPPFETLALRSIAGCLVCAVIITALGEWRAISGLLHPRTLLRAAGETCCTLCYVVALSRMPIADLVSIIQLTPLIVVIGGALLLRERIGALAIVIALIGFAGAVMVAQPTVDGVSSAVLIAAGSALFGAVRDLAGRTVPMRIPVMIVTLATTSMILVAAGGLSLGFEMHIAPTGRHVAFLSIAAVLITGGTFMLLLAYRIGRTAAVAPFFYSFALWGVVSGLIVWGVLPNGLAMAGIALIVGSGVAIVTLDQRRRKIIAATNATA